MRALLLSLLLPAWTVQALRFDIAGRSVAHLKTINANVLAAEDHSDDISSTRDVLYIANVTIEGRSYPLQMDTGSSDLWVDMGSNTPANPTSNTLNLTYGTGNVFGNIAHGPVTFAGYDIPDQAYLVFQSGHNPVLSFGAQGIIGLGFTTLSHIDAAVTESWASSLLYNIFAQNPSEPNFIAMALERESDEHNTVHGSLGVGELAKEYESVSSTDHIPLFPPEGSKRWTVLLDSYVVNGATQNATSTVQDVPAGRLSVLLDSGTTYSYAPPEVAASIYSSVNGAFLNTTTNQWTVPCSGGIRLTLWFAGRAFDIHPLDVVVQSLADPSICIGSFIPTRIAVGASDFDWILGTNILRSVYAVYDFGDFDSNNVMGNPYVQLLSVVDIEEAASSFQAARGGTVPINSGNGSASTSVSVMTTSEKLDKLMNLIPLMFAALGANALILLTILVIGILALLSYAQAESQKAKSCATSSRDNGFVKPCLRGGANCGQRRTSIVGPHQTLDEDVVEIWLKALTFVALYKKRGRAYRAPEHVEVLFASSFHYGQSRRRQCLDTVWSRPCWRRCFSPQLTPHSARRGL
ncbi:related to aspartic peptidase A1-Laccaria bicolor [Serendipita indica DSM 11827]|uniref:Related to aspartic peptidase A1-Laccaria bicolor n=1 Tax=Serendipita indica (strain DSM 11827) TaxID=1109443 RepID=G4T9Z2_SERID|nr:related to aspartic peptidase A1-Laccaria bicolor [Serendipita indica DSM 11827]